MDNNQNTYSGLPISQIKEIVNFIFSEDGYSIKNLNISFPEPLNIKIVRDPDDSISLSFSENLPKVTWQKFIKLSAYVQGLSLGQDSGLLKLKFFPPIRFSYDDNAQALFGARFDTSAIEHEINQEFPDAERNFLAKKCLHYAHEWATIASQGGIDFGSCDTAQQRKLTNDCKRFVLDNIKQDPEVIHGSVILTFILLYIVLPVVLKFILERWLKKLFTK